MQDSCGVDGEDPAQVPREDLCHRTTRRHLQPSLGDTAAGQEAGGLLNWDDELQRARELLKNFHVHRDDRNRGISVYCEAITKYMQA